MGFESNRGTAMVKRDLYQYGSRGDLACACCTPLRGRVFTAAARVISLKYALPAGTEGADFSWRSQYAVDQQAALGPVHGVRKHPYCIDFYCIDFQSNVNSKTIADGWEVAG